VDTDSSGCSDSQRDGDGDGVLDINDQCLDTPSGTTVVAATGCAVSSGTGGGGEDGTIAEEKSSGGLGIDPVLLYGGGAVGLLAVIAIIVTMIGNKPPPRRDADDEFGMHLDSSMDIHIQTSLGESASTQQSTSIGGFTDEQLLSAGWTPEQIAAHRQR
jgi:hypothetical protein